MRHRITTYSAALLLGYGLMGNVQAQSGQKASPLPYAEMIKEARIETNSLKSPVNDAMIQGNGDLNSFFYAKNKQIVLRLAKNDVYDARIDTKNDLPLATIDITTGKTSRQLTLPPSWEKPYPLSINFANVIIGFSGKQHASLDILHSKADINKGEIIIRPLLQDNVYFIKTANPVSIAAQPWTPIPPAENGESNGVKWIKQVLPPDESGDWKGMVVVTALASHNENHFVAVVTSLENSDPLTGAVELAQSYLAKKESGVIEKHENLWLEFWKASGVNLSDKYLTNTWYRNSYISRCAQNPRSTAIGLFIGPMLAPLDGWHDNYTINYNFQQTFWSFLNTNHVEFIDPFNKVVLDYLPRAKWFAKQTYGIEGSFYPHNLYRHEPYNPEECKSNNSRMFAAGPWGYTLGLSGFLMHNLWLSYKYQPTEEKLQKIYPAMLEMARFYINLCEKCPVDDQGKLRIGPSYSPEHEPFGIYNCPFDIAFIQFNFKGFIEASEKLSVNRDLADRAEKYLAMMPEYPVDKVTGFLVDRENGKPIEYNIPVPTTPIFPAEQVTFFSPEKEKELFKNTLQHIETNGNNSAIMLAVAKARLGTPDAKEWLKKEITIRSKPNGSIKLSSIPDQFNNFGHYTEMFAVSGAISELLMQSVDDVIRFFPAWPLDEDAAFTTLRANGGFLVSAELKNKTIVNAEIFSEYGGTLKIVNPWEKVVIRRNGIVEKEIHNSGENGILELNTRPGDRIVLSREN